MELYHHCKDHHITALADAIVHYDCVHGDYETVEEVARALAKENALSIESRAPEKGKKDYLYFPVDSAEYRKGELAMAVSSYRHYSCDHDGWAGSDADKMTRDLFVHLAVSLVDSPVLFDKLIEMPIMQHPEITGSDWLLREPTYHVTPEVIERNDSNRDKTV